MSQPLLLLTDDGRLVVRPARWRERLAAVWHAPRLDEALAAGADPDRAPLLELRARRLLRPRVRAALARELRGVVDEARAGHHRLGRVEPPRRHVVAAASELELLADRLAAPEAVSARGVAEAAALLRDGRGPLYFRTSAPQLRAVAARVAADLQATPSATAR